MEFNKKYVIGIIILLCILVLLSPFADSNPDGLEKAALEDHGAEEGGAFDLGFLTDYGGEDSILHQIIENDMVSTIISGIIGVLIVSGVFFVLYFILKKQKKEVHY